MRVFKFFQRFHGQRMESSRITALPSGYIQRRALSRSSKFFNNGDPSVLPVLTVGAGPVGLVLPILLTKLGAECVVLQKSKNFSKHPEAHFINKPGRRRCSANWMASQWRSRDFEQVVSPVSVAHFSQYKLMRLLLKQLENLNIQIHASEEMEGLNHGILKERQILMGHECLSIDASYDCVTVSVSCFKNREYLQSTIRKLVGIEMKGERELQNLVSVHFLSRDLGQYLLNKRSGMLFFIFNTEAIGVHVAHDLKEGEFVFQIPFYPPQQNVQDFSPKMCEELIFKLVGLELADLDVIDIKPWVMHADVVEKFLCHDNQIRLAGDAAHRFPPAGGFGMSTGIRDSHNLAWKVASVVKGIAPFSIFSTCEAERRPFTIFKMELSIQNFKAAMAVPAAPGLDPSIANSVQRVINGGVGAILPSGLQRAILDGVFAIGRAQLSEFLLNEKNPLGSIRLTKPRQIFNEGKSLQLQFPADDVGFRYLEGALVPDHDGVTGTPEAPTFRWRDSIPTADLGCRLPHMNVWVFLNSSSKIISTLDLILGDKVEFLLIIAPIESSYRLARAALEVAKEFKASIRVCMLWSGDNLKKLK